MVGGVMKEMQILILQVVNQKVHLLFRHMFICRMKIIKVAQ